MITAQEVIDLHKGHFISPKEGAELRCAYCKKNFIAWYGILGQNVKGKKNNCCKYCLDYMRSHFEKRPASLFDGFHEGFRKKRDQKGWVKLSYIEQRQFIRDIADAGIAVYQPPEE